MRKKVNESGAASVAAAALTRAENPATYVLSSAVRVTLASSLSSPPKAALVNKRMDANEADRPFLLCCLAGLIVATVTCGAIAMSAVVMITPAVN
jgi:hypothetical protein